MDDSSTAGSEDLDLAARTLDEAVKVFKRAAENVLVLSKLFWNLCGLKEPEVLEAVVEIFGRQIFIGNVLRRGIYHRC